MAAKNLVVIDSDLEEIVPAFIAKRKIELTLINDAISQQNFDLLMSIGHKLKGNAGGYGFDQLSEYGSQLEIGAKQKDLTTINEAFSLISDYLNDLSIEYKRVD